MKNLSDPRGTGAALRAQQPRQEESATTVKAGVTNAERARQRRLRRARQQNIADLWAALTIVRRAVEDCAPPGSVLNDEYLLPEPHREAEALVRGIYAIAERR